jgi:thioredoxin-dependent peroxiredoxin
MLQKGTLAPGFTLLDDQGDEITLSQFRGKKVVLYFYPKDNTSGCTTEACGFRDGYDDILAKGAVVLGVSPDSVESHTGFKLKFGLPFYLLSDPEHEVSELYGAWGEKKRDDRTYFGILRTTFVIDEEGLISTVFKDVEVGNHAAEVLAAL